MISNEQIFYLRILSDYLHSRKTDVSSVPIDQDLLRRLSSSQQTEAIVYYQTHIPALHSSYLSATYYAVNRRRLLEQIHESFITAHLPYLIFKGTEISSYYPNPEFRQMGDVDILVHSADKERAADALCRMGFASNAENRLDDHEWIFFKRDFEVELHNRLLYSADFNEEVHTSFTDRVWEYTTTDDGILYHLEPEFHFVFLILHLRKHFLWAGVGIRQFMDLAVMMKNADLDWVKVEEYLSELDLLQFTKTCFALIYRWFNISCPIKPASISDDFYFSATETILSDGVFGRMDKESLVNNEVINATRKHGKLLPTLAVIFPPYEQMWRKYPKMGKYRILLPVMWIRRIVESVIFKRARNGMSYATKHLAIGNEMKERAEMLKSWGL